MIKLGIKVHPILSFFQTAMIAVITFELNMIGTQKGGGGTFGLCNPVFCAIAENEYLCLLLRGSTGQKSINHITNWEKDMPFESSTSTQYLPCHLLPKLFFVWQTQGMNLSPSACKLYGLSSRCDFPLSYQILTPKLYSAVLSVC